ncbi:MAG: CRTAC1 family protein, partial [Planctomycetales bacterium]|nr:CRTAC1 family protein [Planctomycetales bacterium]
DGPAMPNNARVLVWLGLAAVCLIAGCRRPASEPVAQPPVTVDPAPATTTTDQTPATVDGQPPTATTDAAAKRAYFTEVTAAWSGVEKREAWPKGEFLTPEITPGGVALFDYDGDGDLDIYQICHCAPALPPRAFTVAAPNRLFRQEAPGKFVEVAGAAGLDDPGYGHGAAIGDIDKDGDLDVYVTNYGPNALYVNNGDGTFTNKTEAAGLTSDAWSSAASFLDYDRDGDLDLYVVNFAKFDPSKRCQSDLEGDEPDYCGPHTFPGLRDTLYQNQGDGTFRDVGQQAGIDAPGRGWGTLCGDLTGDGWPDIYVTNDEEPNQLWVNNRDGTFLDEAVLRGLAFNGLGRVEASMGVTWGDLDRDGRLDLFMTHVATESNTLYASGGSADGESYTDRSRSSGMSSIDLPYTGWGCVMFDVDHDGDLDLAVANGRVAKGVVRPDAKLDPFWNRYAEPNLLFVNSGAGRFEQPPADDDDFSSRVEVTRGLAVGDLDDDGDLDLVTNSIGNGLRIYRNDAPREGTHWLMVRPMTGKRDAVGARVTLELADKSQQVAVAQPSYSYLASNDPAVHFGLGQQNSPTAVLIVWPDGRRERFALDGVDKKLVLRQGEGVADEKP